MAMNSALFQALKGGSMQGAPAPSQSDPVDPGMTSHTPDAPPAPAEGSPPSAGSPLFNLMHSHDLQTNPADAVAFGSKRLQPPEAQGADNPYGNLKNAKDRGEVDQNARDAMAPKKGK